MRPWTPRRGSRYEPDFDSQIASLGFDMWLWDGAAPLVEDILCGAEREFLDAVFPENRDGIRLLID